MPSPKQKAQSMAGLGLCPARRGAPRRCRVAFQGYDPDQDCRACCRPSAKRAEVASMAITDQIPFVSRAGSSNCSLCRRTPNADAAIAKLLVQFVQGGTCANQFTDQGLMPRARHKASCRAASLPVLSLAPTQRGCARSAALSGSGFTPRIDVSRGPFNFWKTTPHKVVFGCASCAPRQGEIGFAFQL
jgi:hypothetical protein